MTEAGPTSGRLIRVDEAAAQPWRNGGGRTRELLAWPSSANWIVRVSVADVAADGPFSRFAETQRWFAVLEGEGVELTIDGAVHRLQRADAPLAFSGEASTHCRLLDGPTRDLNLMLRGTGGRMLPVEPAADWQPHAVQCGLFAAVPGRCLADGRALSVPAGALLWFAAAPAAVSFAAARSSEPPGYWLALDGTEGR